MRTGNARDFAEPQFQLEAPTLSLPKGGAAIKSVDEPYRSAPSHVFQWPPAISFDDHGVALFANLGMSAVCR